jgi:protein gp37
MTGIEWTDAVWNPTTGCDRVSPGCDNCYAMTMAKRLKGMGQAKYQTDGDPRTSGPGFGIATHADALALPLGWRKPKRVFVNSMSDLFHDGVPDRFIARVWAVMHQTPRHTYQVLTKRHGRMRSLLNAPRFQELVGQSIDEMFDDPDDQLLREPWPPRNVWLGVSVENQQWADIRIPALLETPAAVRWLSMEPLLGPVDLRGATGDWLGKHGPECLCLGCHNVRTGSVSRPPWWGQANPIGWVVVGGESGPGARPMMQAWTRSLRDQCAAADVPFFFKQWGQWAPDGDSPDPTNNHSMAWFASKKAAGRWLDGKLHDAYPAVAR